ncbi:MAG: DNA polymerase III subunit beta [Planctomycetota bacterium]|jgi:DNA polymerase-3 subunit beta
MKLVCERSKLLAAAQAAAEVAPTRPTRPIAQGVLFDVGKDGVVLAATDYDVGIRYTLETKKTSGQGRAVVNAGQLLAVVRDLSDEEIQLEMDADRTVITCGGSRMNLPGMDEGDFPEVSGVGSDRTVKLPVGEVVGMLDRVAFAAGQEESRYAINGVFVKVNKRDLEVVATDARRLAMMKRKLPKDTKLQRSAILPLKLVGMLKKLSAGQEELRMVLRESEAVFACGPAVLVGRLVEGTYPKYEEAIPKDCDKTVSIDREKFRSALKQAMNFTTEDTRSVTLLPKKGKMVVEARVAERGEASIVVEADYKGPDLEVAFNPQYLLDAAGRLEKDVVELQLKDSSRPGLITEGKDYLSVVMPVRLRGE